MLLRLIAPRGVSPPSGLFTNLSHVNKNRAGRERYPKAWCAAISCFSRRILNPGPQFDPGAPRSAWREDRRTLQRVIPRVGAAGIGRKRTGEERALGGQSR